jgi:hypothetical protein
MRLIGALFLLIVIVGMMTSNKETTTTAASAPAATAPVAAAEPPKKKEPPPTPRSGEQVSSDFFDYIHAETSYDCVQAIKRFVKYDIRSPGALWGKNTGDSMLFLLRMSRVSKKVAADNTIMLAGDEAEAQNGFGNWVRVSYTCTINLADKSVKRASIENGRLP